MFTLYFAIRSWPKWRLVSFFVHLTRFLTGILSLTAGCLTLRHWMWVAQFTVLDLPSQFGFSFQMSISVLISVWIMLFFISAWFQSIFHFGLGHCNFAICLVSVLFISYALLQCNFKILQLQYSRHLGKLSYRGWS